MGGVAAGTAGAGDDDGAAATSGLAAGAAGGGVALGVDAFAATAGVVA